MRFVIWGNGEMGKRLLNLLGEEKIVAFIERNTALQGTTYKNVPIIDFSVYQKDYIHYPIIISPWKAAEEIHLFLRERKIWWSFPFYEYTLPDIMGFLRQAPIEDFVRSYNQNETLFIYGLNLLSVIMFDYFGECGYSCRIIPQYGVDKAEITGIKEQTEVQFSVIEEVCPGQRVLLAMEMVQEDTKRLADKSVLEEYYRLAYEKELYYNPKLEKFRNCHAGQRCFIVATGPSLRISDLELLHREKEISISVNGICKAFDKTEWRPDYYVISDPIGVDCWEDEIFAMEVVAKFIADGAWHFHREPQKNMYKWHLLDEPAAQKMPKFSDDFSRVAYTGYTIVYNGALQLAAYMGFKEIYLLGTDCTQVPGKKVEHFVSDYAPDEGTLSVEKTILAYQSAKRYADTHGIKIYNATRGGALEVFERVDFDSLFEK